MKIAVKAAALVALVAMANPVYAGEPITAVAVLDAQFQPVKKLAPQELPALERQWNGKTEVADSLRQGEATHFKLDIEAGTSAGRWLYSTSGLVQRLSKTPQPVYKMSDSAEFNRLVGAEK